MAGKPSLMPLGLKMDMMIGATEKDKKILVNCTKVGRKRSLVNTETILLTHSGWDGGRASVDGRCLAHLSGPHLIEHVTKAVHCLIHTSLWD